MTSFFPQTCHFNVNMILVSNFNGHKNDIENASNLFLRHFLMDYSDDASNLFLAFFWMSYNDNEIYSYKIFKWATMVNIKHISNKFSNGLDLMHSNLSEWVTTATRIIIKCHKEMKNHKREFEDVKEKHKTNSFWIIQN